MLDAIAGADAIVLGPGDIYTSVLPNLLVEDVAEAVKDSRAVKIHVCNLMTKPNESAGFRTSNFLGLLTEYLGTRQPLDFLLVNNTPIPSRLVSRYAAEGQHPVRLDEAESLTMVGRIVQRPLLAPGVFVRHDPAALASAIMEIAVAVPVATDDAPQESPVLDCDDWSGPPLTSVPYRVQAIQRETGAGHVDATLTVRSNDPDGG